MLRLPRLRFFRADERLAERAIDRGLFRVGGTERGSREAWQKGNDQTDRNRPGVMS